MTQYINVKVNISQGQIDKIKHAVQEGSAVSIKLSHSDLEGEYVLALTHTQVNKIAKAHKSGSGVIIKLSKTQLRHNAKVEGGFLGAILPMLATAGRFLLSTLATGVLSGVGQAAGSTAVNKIAGNGVNSINGINGVGNGIKDAIYLKKNGLGCKIRTAGQGLYLSPWQKGSSLGDGMFLKTGSGYIDGSGLLLGPDSPFQNIPILGMLL